MIEDATLEPLRARGYELGGFLGSGAFSEVIAATQTSTGAQVAIKRVTGGGADAAAFAASKRRSVRLPSDDSSSSLQPPPPLAPPPAPGAREAAALRELRGHPNVIQLLDEVELPDDHAPPTSTALVLERACIDAVTLLRYAPSIGSVGNEDDEDDEDNGEEEEGTSFVVGGGALDPSLTKALVRGVLAAVGALSRRRIAHRDVKPGNVLLTADGRVALADLGLAARWPSPRNGGGEDLEESENGTEPAASSPPAPPPQCCPLSHRPLPPAGTRWYRPPEALYGGPADEGPGADLWGAGCLLAEALGLSAPLAAGETDLDQVSRVSEALGGAPDPREWPGLAELPDFAALASVTAGGCCCWGRGSDDGEGEEEEKEEQEEVDEEREAGGAGGAGIDGGGDRSRSRSRSRTRTSLAARLPDAPASALDLLSTLLAYDPSRRGTAESALAHAFFREPPLPAPRGRVAAAVAAVVEAAERDRARAQQQRRRRQQQQQQQ